jgi:hypothetical protein
VASQFDSDMRLPDLKKLVNGRTNRST